MQSLRDDVRTVLRTYSVRERFCQKRKDDVISDAHLSLSCHSFPANLGHYVQLVAIAYRTRTYSTVLIRSVHLWPARTGPHTRGQTRRFSCLEFFSDTSRRINQSKKNLNRQALRTNQKAKNRPRKGKDQPSDQNRWFDSSRQTVVVAAVAVGAVRLLHRLRPNRIEFIPPREYARTI
jgi:hypothetical protein